MYLNMSEKLKFCLGKLENIVGKKRKCWQTAFSSFPEMFSKGFFFKIIKSSDCVVQYLLTHSHTMRPFDTPGKQAF